MRECGLHIKLAAARVPHGKAAARETHATEKPMESRAFRVQLVARGGIL